MPDPISLIHTSSPNKINGPVHLAYVKLAGGPLNMNLYLDGGGGGISCLFSTIPFPVQDQRSVAAEGTNWGSQEQGLWMIQPSSVHCQKARGDIMQSEAAVTLLFPSPR